MLTLSVPRREFVATTHHKGTSMGAIYSSSHNVGLRGIILNDENHNYDANVRRKANHTIAFTTIEIFADHLRYAVKPRYAGTDRLDHRYR